RAVASPGAVSAVDAPAPARASTLVDLAFTPAEEAFRAELREWLRANIPPPAEPATLADEVAFLRAWQRQLHDGRWVGIHWPREYGGRGASVVEHYIFQEEMAAARAPEILNRIGVNLVGPTLIAHGSEAQKRRFLPQILPADELWCQLFSEPGAGSDLTALRTRAERRGDGWVVTGQKVWTSYAQFARWGILLARTDLAAPGSRGISYFVCDLQAPGVTVRPLRQMTGSEEFNEVFLEVEFTRLNNWRTLTRLQRREPLGPESSFVKLFWSEMSQRMHDTLMELLGPSGLCWRPGPHAVAGGRLARSYLYYRAASLFAGTSEIQRNILAERVLGLPRSRA